MSDVLDVKERNTVYLHRHDLALRDLAVLILVDVHDVLRVHADWDEHASRRCELVDERLWQLRRCGADVDSVIRTACCVSYMLSVSSFSITG